MANNTSTSSGTRPIDYATSSTVWTAADWGANETVSGVTIMQYQNAKKNTVNLNKWTKIVDTTCRVNAKLGVSGATTGAFILPPSTWLNTSEYTTLSSVYSGYQLFVQCFGSQGFAVNTQPSITILTELEVEFLQPAFQANISNFASNAFSIRMVTIPDGNLPDDTRVYVFDRIIVETDETTSDRVMNIRLKREDGQPGSLTYTAKQLRTAIREGNSGQYFSGRPIVYDGPTPPTAIPTHDLQLEALQ